MKCGYCGKNFKLGLDLEEHQLDHHWDEIEAENDMAQAYAEGWS